MKFRLYARSWALLCCPLAATTCQRSKTPHNIVVEGKKMTQAEFLEKYCAGRAITKRA